MLGLANMSGSWALGVGTSCDPTLKDHAHGCHFETIEQIFIPIP